MGCLRLSSEILQDLGALLRMLQIKNEQSVDIGMPKHESTGSHGWLANIAAIFRNRNLQIILVTWIIFGMMHSTFDQFASDYARRLGASARIIGLMGSATMIINMLMQIPGGYIADKRGRKRLVAWGTFLVAFPVMLRAIAASWESYFFATTLVNAVGTFYNPGLSAIYQDSLPTDRRGFTDSLIHGLSWALPAILGSFLGGVIYERYDLNGLRASLAVTATVYLISGLLRSRLKETIDKGSEMERLDLKGAFSALKRSFLSLPDTLSWAFGSLRPLLGFELLLGIVHGIWPFWVLYALDVIGMSRFGWGLINSVFNLIYFPLSLIGGGLSDKRGRVRQMRLVPIMWVLGTLVFIKARSLEMALISWLFSLSADIFWWPALTALWIDLVPRRRRGRVSSARGIVFHLSAIFGSGLAGYLYSMKEAYPFYIVLAIQTGMLVISLFLKEPEQREM